MPFFKVLSNSKIILILFLLIASNLYALPESVQVSGTVYDKLSGYPIAGANVDIVEQIHHCITSEYGDFQFLILDEGEFTLQISAVGFHTFNSIINLKDSTYFRIYLVSSDIISNEVIVSDTYLSNDFLTKKLKGRDLQLNQKGTIAESMQNMTGINIRSMGAATSRPIVNGMSNNRVKIIENEFETGDLSATSNDHSLSMTSAGLESIEIINGSDILEYGSITSSAILKMNKYSKSNKAPEKILLESGTQYESSNNSLSNYLKICQPISNLVVKGNYSNYNSNDMRSPNKTLQNTSSFVESYGGGLVYFYDNLKLNFNYSKFYNQYGIPGGFIGAHPNGVNIDMNKSNLDFGLNLKLNNSYISSIDAEFALINYKHKEYEGRDILGAEFAQDNYLAKIDLNKNSDNKYGRMGLTYNFKDYKVGGYVFTPYVKSNNFSLYYIKDYSTDFGNFKFGGRFESVIYNPYKYADTNYQRGRDFNDIALNLDYSINFHQKIKFISSIGRFFRPPSIEELYSRGPHLAAYTYEKGNANLNIENGYSLSAGLNYKDELVNLTVKSYYNYFNSMILFRNSGDTNWAQFLPIYSAQNINGLMYGFQFEYKINISDNINLDGNIFGTIGENLTDNRYIPEIPPFTGNLSLNIKTEIMEIAINSKFADSQNRLDQFESSTPSYIIYGLSLHKSFLFSELLHSISVSIDNIFDNEYYNHLSRIKSIMPEQGRNIRVNYKIYY